MWPVTVAHTRHDGTTLTEPNARRPPFGRPAPVVTQAGAGTSAPNGRTGSRAAASAAR